MTQLSTRGVASQTEKSPRPHPTVSGPSLRPLFAQQSPGPHPHPRYAPVPTPCLQVRGTQAQATEPPVAEEQLPEPDVAPAAGNAWFNWETNRWENRGSTTSPRHRTPPRSSSPVYVSPRREVPGGDAGLHAFHATPVVPGPNPVARAWKEKRMYRQEERRQHDALRATSRERMRMRRAVDGQRYYELEPVPIPRPAPARPPQVPPPSTSAAPGGQWVYQEAAPAPGGYHHAPSSPGSQYQQRPASPSHSATQDAAAFGGHTFGSQPVAGGYEPYVPAEPPRAAPPVRSRPSPPRRPEERIIYGAAPSSPAHPPKPSAAARYGDQAEADRHVSFPQAKNEYPSHASALQPPEHPRHRSGFEAGEVVPAVRGGYTFQGGQPRSPKQKTPKGGSPMRRRSAGHERWVESSSALFLSVDSLDKLRHKCHSSHPTAGQPTTRSQLPACLAAGWDNFARGQICGESFPGENVGDWAGVQLPVHKAVALRFGDFKGGRIFPSRNYPPPPCTLGGWASHT